MASEDPYARTVAAARVEQVKASWQIDRAEPRAASQAASGSKWKRLSVASTWQHGRTVPSVLHQDGNVVIAGTAIGKEPDYPSDIVVAKLSPTGKVLWDLRHDEGEADSADVVAINAEGEITVGGAVGDKDSRILWIQKYDADAKELWTNPIGYESGFEQRLTDIAILPNGDMIAVGSISIGSSDPLGPSAAWANLYDREGVALWPRPFLLSSTSFQDPLREGTSPISLDELTGYAAADAVAVDPNGNVVVIGVRETELWLRNIETRPGVVHACERDGLHCADPFVYQRTPSWPRHRQLAIDRDGSLLLFGEATDPFVDPSEDEVWFGKLRFPTFPKDED